MPVLGIGRVHVRARRCSSVSPARTIRTPYGPVVPSQALSRSRRNAGASGTLEATFGRDECLSIHDATAQVVAWRGTQVHRARFGARCRLLIGKSLEIVVRHTRMRIAEEALPHIFEEFRPVVGGPTCGPWRSRPGAGDSPRTGADRRQHQHHQRSPSRRHVHPAPSGTGGNHIGGKLRRVRSVVVDRLNRRSATPRVRSGRFCR